ncbi:MAG: hypothetical protein ACT4N2_03580 [Hyphomicrobium sp.]
MRGLLVMVSLIVASASVRAEPADSYAIVREDATATSRVVAVRIGERLAASRLARIAGLLKASGSMPTTRHVQVSFYLPRMPLDQRPWASVDMTPHTKVTIGGLSLEEQRQLEAEAADDRRTVIGTWLTDLPSVPGRLTIFSEAGKTMLEWRQRGGSTTLDEVVAVRGTRAVRYDLHGGSGDYYLAKSSGELELRSGDRLIAIAAALSRKRPARSSPEVAADLPTSNSPASDTPPAVNMLTSATATDAVSSETAAAIAPLPVEAVKPVRKKRIAKRDRGGPAGNGRISFTDYIRSEIAQ